MMENIQTIDKIETVKLIKGTFDPVDAAEVLFSILSDKIRFHNIQILSIKERFSGDTKYSEQRLNELKEAKQKVANLILEARDQDCQIEINSNIEIRLKSK